MIPTVSNSITRWMLDILSTAGVDVAPLIEKCQLSQYEITKEKGRIPAEKHYQFQIETREYVKLFYSSTSPELFYQLFPDFLSACLNQESAYKAIETFVRYRHIKGNHDDLVLQRRGNKLLVEYKSHGPQSLTNSSAIGNFILLFGILKEYLPSMVTQITFAGSSPLAYKEINDRFNTHCQFEQSTNQMIIESDSLDMRQSLFNEKIFNLQMAQLKQTTMELNRSQSFTLMVKEMINMQISDGLLEKGNTIMDSICFNLKLSRWTLNNKLNEDGTSFTELLKSVRLNRACQLLIESNKSIQEISDLTCFSSQASFSRFFSSHINISPIQYRKQFKGHEASLGRGATAG